MPSIKRDFYEGGFYHVFNRGVEKRDVFMDNTDYDRFLRRLIFYQQISTPKRFSDVDFDLGDRVAPYHFEILAYCLMPNHFHLLLGANSVEGISSGIGQTLNSYTRYFNTRHKRVGSLFQGTFKSVHVETTEQLLHVHRYIHLNPFVAGLERTVGERPWSSFHEYFSEEDILICNRSRFYASAPLAGVALNEFTTDFADYARSAKILQKVSFDDEE